MALGAGVTNEEGGTMVKINEIEKVITTKCTHKA